MRAHRHASQGGHRLALASRRRNDDLVVVVATDFVDVDDRAFGRCQISQLHRDVRDVDHAAPEDCHFAAIAHGGVDDLLDARDIRGEGGDDDASACAPKDAVEGDADGRFAGHRLDALGVRAVGEHEQDALVADFRECLEVREFSVDRRVVHLEIARVEDRADRRANGERHGIGDAVVHAHELDGETAETQLVARHDGMEVLRRDAAFLQAPLEYAERQRRAVNGHVDLCQDIRQGADVIFVAVREHDALDAVTVLQEIGDVRDDEVDAEHVLRREHQSCVDDEDVVAEAKNRHVLADFPESAQGDDLQLFRVAGMICRRCGRMCV